MNAIDYILSFFKRKPKTPEQELQEKQRQFESKRAEAMLKLAREKDKSNPDALTVDRCERELAVWDELLKKLKSKK